LRKSLYQKEFDERLQSRIPELQQLLAEFGKQLFFTLMLFGARFSDQVKRVSAAITEEVRALKERLNQHYRANVVKQLDACFERLGILMEQRTDLEIRRTDFLSRTQDLRPPWLYGVMYALIAVSMFAAAALTSQMLFAEQGVILSWVTSVVFVGGAYLLNGLYWGKLRETDRSDFLNKIHKRGLVFFIGMALSFAIGRAAVLLDMSSAGSFLYQSDWLTILQSATAIFAFVFMVLLELCFGASVYILVNKRLHPRIELKAIEASIREVEAAIATERNRADELADELAEIEQLEKQLQAWTDEATSRLMADFEVKERYAFDSAMRQIMMNRSDMSELLNDDIFVQQPFPSQATHPLNGGFTHAREQHIPSDSDGGNHNRAHHFRL